VKSQILSNSLTHGRGNNFSFQYTGRGELTYGLPRPMPDQLLQGRLGAQTSYDYLTKSLQRAPGLRTRLVDTNELLVEFLQNISVISIIGGMTGLLESSLGYCQHRYLGSGDHGRKKASCQRNGVELMVDFFHGLGF
jgi:hypothetical protein